MDNLNTETLGRIPLQIPPKEEQRHILNFVSEISGSFNQIIQSAGKAAELLKERRTALISAAVTGKIDVRNWQAPESTSTSSMDANPYGLPSR
ncbi:hypothetical protein IMCC3135_28585 [Granulosicoccus antarcticus IMCC3135]|uniref:Type I restriction modification DNA specificity domain-containing protein n=2 Tax=Granulosicoccus TaxID=437504 RepID=A0A2Z2NWP0_9GAMM|nr:hypothetical protein IMCC3135_28585 [Granulosicoccus antarcticus IMCC3135]